MWPLVLAIALVLVTVLGHGLWLLAAWAIRQLGGSPHIKQPSLRPCVSCGRSTPARDNRCEWCGASLDVPRFTEMADHAALVRSLRRLVQQGVINEKEVEDLLARIEAHRRQQFQAARSAAPQAAAGSAGAPRVSPAPPQPPKQAPQRTPPREVPVAELVEKPACPAGVSPVPSAPGAASAQRAATSAVSPPAPRAHDARVTPAPMPQRPLPPDAPRPRRSWAQLVEAFMEERNMRWGELIGGLLIVGGGVALAISLRERLQAIPYSQFLIFALITAGVYGAGLYSHYRWRLATTSRGLLTIAMLLTPVSFLIMARLSGGDSQPITLAVDAAGLVVFSGLAWLAARVVVADRPWLAVLGAVGNSAVALAMTPLAQQQLSPAFASGVGVAPSAVLLAAVAGWLAGRRTPAEPASPRSARRWLYANRSTWLLTLLGVSLFAWIVAEGHYLAEIIKQTGLTAARDECAAPLAAAAVAPLLAGLALLRHSPAGEAMEPYRAAGTAIALAGMTAMLVALAFAWPWPEMLLAVGLFDAAVLAAAALRYRAPILHAGTIFSTALVVLVGYHARVAGLFGPPDDQVGRELLDGVTSAASGNLLGVLFVVSAAVAEWFVRTGRRRDAAVYAIGCGALAVVGLSLVTWRGAAGGADALRASILYGVYGLIGVGLAVRWNKLTMSYLGLTLIQGAAL